MSYVEASVRSRQLVAAARVVLAREGVANTSLRAVAAEGGVSLGTLQYVFASKERLLQAVIEDVVDEVAQVFSVSVPLRDGLAHAIRHGLTHFWSQFVANQVPLQMMQYELTKYALRTPGQEHLARWQYERYASAVATCCQAAASHADEICAVPFARLARVMLASMDGLILQYLCDPRDDARAREDLDAIIDMLTSYAGIQPAGVAGTQA